MSSPESVWHIYESSDSGRSWDVLGGKGAPIEFRERTVESYLRNWTIVELGWPTFTVAWPNGNSSIQRRLTIIRSTRLLPLVARK